MKNKLYNYVENFVIAFAVGVLLYVVFAKFCDIATTYIWIYVMVGSAAFAYFWEDK